MNKKPLIISVLIILVALYVAWKIYEVKSERQRAHELELRAAQEQIPYRACMDNAEEKYKRDLQSIDLVDSSAERIDEELTRYKEQYEQRDYECFSRYSAAAMQKQIQTWNRSLR